MSKIDFFVQNHTEASTYRRILVFLRPQLQAQALFHAWQTLSPPPRGGSHSFSFEGFIEVDTAEDHPEGSRSPRLPILPGQVFKAHTRNGQGPQLSPALGENQPDAPARVINGDDRSLRVTWYCDSRPFLRQTVAEGSSAELRLLPDVFLFQVLEPSRDGLYRASEVLRQAIEYRPPQKTRLVDVIWYCSGDTDGLSFDPPSAIQQPSAPEPTAFSQASSVGERTPGVDQ